MEAVNIYYNTLGEIKKIPFKANAVIVNIVPYCDDDGNELIERIVTIAAVDINNENMMALLKDEAHRILDNAN